MAKRVFLIVLDSVGAGEAPDAAAFGDQGCDTLGTCMRSGRLNVPVMESLGLRHLKGTSFQKAGGEPIGCYGKMQEKSAGKDTTVGHWEIAGLISERPLPTYPEGFPEEIIREFEKRTGRGVLCNRPYSGTEVIRDYGREQVSTGKLIVYTSADSVFQIAAHEDVVPVEELYRCCRIARELLTGEHGVGRVIARPFTGEYPEYTRTVRRHDFSLEPPGETLLDALKAEGKDVIGVGKISDIFAGRGLTDSYPNEGNRKNMERTLELADKHFPFYLQTHHEEENCHQGVIYPQPQAHVNGELPQCESCFIVPDVVEPSSSRHGSHDYGEHRTYQQQDAGHCLVLEESIEYVEDVPVSVIFQFLFHGCCRFRDFRCDTVDNY